MKLSLDLTSPKRIWINIGWYSGEEFSLFRLDLFRFWDSGGGTILEFVIAKFTILSFGWYE